MNLKTRPWLPVAVSPPKQPEFERLTKPFLPKLLQVQNMFKNLNGLAQLLKNASSMGERVKEMRASLAAQSATGQAGGDLVQVEISGIGEVRRLRISPELMEKNDVELLEELIPAAMNEALTKVREMHVEKMREATGGIDLPGLDEALANM